jgi:hypothetical protein
MPVIPPGILLDHFQAYDSMLKVKGMADIIITLHEDEYVYKDSIP